MSVSEGSYSADRLLSRPVSLQYIEEWTKILREGKKTYLETREHSILLFRLHNEWFGLSTSFFNQICEKKPIHIIPHKQNPILKGLVNIGGQMRLCVDLKNLLEIKEDKKMPPPQSAIIYNRMIVIENEGQLFVFPVDEAFGIYQFDMGALENVPVNVAKSSTNYLRGVLTWKGKSVGFLDEELLFYSLKRSL